MQHPLRVQVAQTHSSHAVRVRDGQAPRGPRGMKNMSAETRSELLELLWSICVESASPAELERFQQLAVEYPEVYELYARVIGVCGVLEWQFSALRTLTAQPEGGQTEAPGITEAPGTIR